MTQRVNIQYSIEMKELEAEVERLLGRAHQLLNNTTAGFESPPSVLSISGMDYIEGMRKKLLDVDVALADINRIIGGYVSYRAPQTQPAHNNEELADNESEEPLVDQGALVGDIINRFREVSTAYEEPS